MYQDGTDVYEIVYVDSGDSGNVMALDNVIGAVVLYDT